MGIEIIFKTIPEFLILFLHKDVPDEVIFDIAISGPPASSFLKGSVSVALLSKKE